MIEVRPFDPHTATRAEWDGFHALRRTLALEDAPERPVVPDELTEQFMREPDPQWQSRYWLALVGEAIVGRLQLALRSGSDPSRYAGEAAVMGGVLPARRREGIAMHLAQQLLAVMESERLHMARFPVTHLALGAPFMQVLGARATYRELDNRLPLAEVDWKAIAAHVDRVPAALRWECHVPRTPVERLHALAPAITTLLSDIPREDSSYPTPVFEAHVYESRYRDLERTGGSHLMVMVFDGEELAAVCDTFVAGTLRDLANQQFTGVARRWRGHGLGLAVKARTLQLLREFDPPVRTVHTKNALSNAPMIRVNEQLGFRAHRECAVYELPLSALARALRAGRSTASPRR